MANRRSLIELKFKIADRLTDPTLGFFMWNLNIQQLECPRGSPRSMLRRAEPTSWTPAIEPFNPNVARALYSDGFLIGIWIEIIFNIFGEGKFWLVCWSSDIYAAPAGCLQYFPQPEGIIESFNYNGGTGPYLPNQDYAICFRRREEDTKLLWVFFSIRSVMVVEYCSLMFPQMCLYRRLRFESFELTGDGDGLDTNCLAATADATKSEDYLSVPFALTQDNKRASRLCGTSVARKRVTCKCGGDFQLRCRTSFARWSDSNFSLFVLNYSQSARSIYHTLPQWQCVYGRQGEGIPF